MASDLNLLSPFVEGPVFKKLWTQVSYSSAVGSSYPLNQNQFRQGIELSTEDKLYAGTVKIHAGWPEHKLPQQEFGFSKTQISSYVRYEEIDSFNPSDFINVSNFTRDENERRIYTSQYALSEVDIDNNEYFNLDGRIEPLHIRNRFLNLSSSLSKEHTSVTGLFGNGNPNFKNMSDQITDQISVREERIQTYYFDSVDSTPGRLPSLGDLDQNVSTIYPVTDGIKKYSILTTTNMPTEMVQRLREMAPPEDCYVSSKFKTLGIGSTYDSNNFGTDSIAFGGLSNSNIVTWESNKE